MDRCFPQIFENNAKKFFVIAIWMCSWNMDKNNQTNNISQMLRFQRSWIDLQETFRILQLNCNNRRISIINQWKSWRWWWRKKEKWKTEKQERKKAGMKWNGNWMQKMNWYVEFDRKYFKHYLLSGLQFRMLVLNG